MIDSVIYAPAPRPAATNPAQPAPASGQVLVPQSSSDAPISQAGPRSRLDSYRQISAFTESAPASEVISGIDIRV